MWKMKILVTEIFAMYQTGTCFSEPIGSKSLAELMSMGCRKRSPVLALALSRVAWHREVSITRCVTDRGPEVDYRKHGAYVKMYLSAYILYLRTTCDFYISSTFQFSCFFFVSPQFIRRNRPKTISYEEALEQVKREQRWRQMQRKFFTLQWNSSSEEIPFVVATRTSFLMRT